MCGRDSFGFVLFFEVQSGSLPLVSFVAQQRTMVISPCPYQSQFYRLLTYVTHQLNIWDCVVQSFAS